MEKIGALYVVDELIRVGWDYSYRGIERLHVTRIGEMIRNDKVYFVVYAKNLREGSEEFLWRLYNPDNVIYIEVAE